MVPIPDVAALQVRDLRGALQSVQERGEVDASRTFLVTWSYAGEGVFGLHRSDPRIRGIVAMSTNLLHNWVYAPPESVASIPDGPLDVPVLLVEEELGRDGRLRPADVAAGLVGAVVKDLVSDQVAWDEYLEVVVRPREDWAEFYRACREVG